ncbi:MAG: hypothetical protein Kow0097_09980 [Candidatus Bipolaricaulota bacterium]
MGGIAVDVCHGGGGRPALPSELGSMRTRAVIEVDLDHAQTGICSLSLASQRDDGLVPWTYRAKPMDFLWRRGPGDPIRSVDHRGPTVARLVALVAPLPKRSG